MSYDAQMSKECYQHSEKVLGETEEIRETSLTEIYNWLDNNPKINAHRDAKTILHFLRGTKFNIDKAKKKIKKYVYLSLFFVLSI